MLSNHIGLPKDVFLALDFDPKKFVQKRLTGQPNEEDKKLDMVVKDLQATVQDLTDQLLALIDRDHQTFLELSGDLIRVDTTVGTLRGPLAHLKEKVDAVKRAAAGPADAIRDYDQRLAAVRAKKKQLQERMVARALRQSIEKDLLSNNENRGAQKLSLLSRIIPASECADLKREIEHKLCDRIMDQPKDVVRARLRSLVMLGSLDSVRRTMTADLSAHDQETVLDRVLSHHKPLLEACAEEGLGSIFELPSKSILPAAALSAGKLVSSSEARKAEALRKVLSYMSPTGMPHATLRWNPRMHSELQFQDAVSELDKNQTVEGLESALNVLYGQERSMSDVNKDLILASHLFRMACRLVSGYLGHVEGAPREGHLVVDRVNESFLVRRRLLDGTLLHPPFGGQTGKECTDTLAERARLVGVSLLQSLQQTLIESCGNEVTALDRSITTQYRSTNKPLRESPSPTVTNILQPLVLMIDQLLGVAPEGLAQWADHILDEIRVKFLQVADAMVKRESTLVRYHQRTAKAGMSDSYKIGKQMAIDAEDFIEQAAKLMENRLDVKTFNRKPFEDIVKLCLDFANTAGSGAITQPGTPTPGAVTSEVPQKDSAGDDRHSSD